MTLANFGGFFAGLAVLVLGSELLVRGASSIGLRLGLSPLVIGLTIVAIGTSSPEAAVTIQAAAQGNPGIALGNVVGSSVFNVLFILGFAALLLPLTVSRELVRLHVPLMVACTALAFGMSLDGRLGRVDGIVLVAGMAAYVGLLYWLRHRELATDEGVNEADVGGGTQPGVLLSLGMVAAGLAMLFVSPRWLVASAVDMARSLGVSDVIVGLTIVSAGTSLPEVATSISASLQGRRDLAVGNVVGSNIFNILFVLGSGAMVASGGIPVPTAMLGFDFPIMLAVAVACLPILFTRLEISRWEGAVFLAYYAAYTAYLILDAQGHDALPAFSGILMLFVVPITGITLMVLAGVEIRVKRRDRRAALDGGRPGVLDAVLGRIEADADPDPKARIDRALQLAAEALGLEVGIVARIRAEEGIYRVVHAHAPGSALHAGMEAPLGDTYCSLALERRDLVAIHDAGRSRHAAHPCHRMFGIESYVGVPFWARGFGLGTVNFSTSVPNRAPFTEGELEFVRRLAAWVVVTLESRTSA